MGHQEVQHQRAQAGGPDGPKYFVDIEGTVYEWDQPTITTEQIEKLGGWDASQGVIEIDEHNNEKTL